MIAATRLHARLQWTHLVRGRVLWGASALVALPVLGAAALVGHGDGGRDLFDNLMELYFYFLVPFVPALIAAGAIADEIEGRTHTFLFARPAPRVAIVLGKWASSTAAAGALLVGAITLVLALSLVRDTSSVAADLVHAARCAAAALVGAGAFAALATAAGALFPRHPLMAVGVYLVVVEAVIGSTPLVVNLAAVSWHLRNLADLGQPSNFVLTLHVPVAVSLAVALAIAAGALALAVWLVEHAEYV